MKIKAHDTYGGQHLIIDLGDDEVYLGTTSSRWSSGSVYIEVTLDEAYYKAHPDESAEDPQFKRWSDLRDVVVVK